MLSPEEHQKLVRALTPVDRNTIVCNVCGVNKRCYIATNYVCEAGLVQLRHFDGTDYFWDIGKHLLLQESVAKSEPIVETSQVDGKGCNRGSEMIAVEDLLFRDGDSKHKFYHWYQGLSPAYLSGNLMCKPLKTWQEGGKIVSLFEKKGSIRPDLRGKVPGCCLNCGCMEEHKRLWTKSNKSLLQFLEDSTWGYIWSVGSRMIIKDLEDGNNVGAEEAAVKYVRDHTNIPVPSWIHSWHEDTRALVLMDRLPGVTYEEIWDEEDEEEQLTEEDLDTIREELTEYIKQLRELRSPEAKTADNQLLRNVLFWRQIPEAQWQLMPTYEEDREQWFKKSLSGVGQSDLPELERLKEMFPASESYVFTHGDLTSSNILISNGHISGIIDWELSGFAPVWWERMGLSLHFRDCGMPWFDKESEFLRRWESIYITAYHRSLRAYQIQSSSRFEDDDEVYEKLREDPIGPTPPPYPSKAKKIWTPRRYQDMEGQWHDREILPPMIALPEFNSNAWHIQ